MASFIDLSDVLQDVFEQAVGIEEVSQLDFSDIASLGDYVLSSADTTDIIFSKLVDRIGKTVIANRLYKGKYGFIAVDPFTYGYVLQKIHVKCFPTRENGKYYNGTSPDTDLYAIFRPEIDVSLFANSKAWEFAVTIEKKQIKTAFTDEKTLTAFINGIYTAMDTSVSKSIEDNASATLATYIGEHIVAQTAADTAGENKVLAINLIKAYYEDTGETVSAADAWYNAAFLRWCTSKFIDTKRMMANLTVIFNDKGLEKHTPEDYLNFVIFGKFADNIKRFMQSDVYNKELVSMPKYQELDYWQGIGTGDITSRTTINAKLVSVDDNDANNTINKSNIIGVMFDDFAVGTTLYDRETVAVPNPHRHRTNHFEQCMCGNFIDMSENGVVFYLEDYANPLEDFAADTTLPEDLLGKAPSDLQENIVITDDNISGTLKYVTGYTGFSGDVSQQSGNFLAIHVTIPTGSTVKVFIIGGDNTEPKTMDSDGVLVARIKNTNEKVQFTVIKDGYRTVTKTYSLKNLTLNTP